jgi:hypothetical protein
MGVKIVEHFLLIKKQIKTCKAVGFLILKMKTYLTIMMKSMKKKI